MDKKLNILFVIPSFVIGGTTSSLEAFLSLLDKSKVSPTVFALNQTGPRKESFEKYHLLPDNLWLSTKIVNGGRVKRFVHRLLSLIGSAFSRINVNLAPIYARIGGRQLSFEKYDIVVAFVESLARAVAYYPIEKKFIFIRSEFERHIGLCDFGKEHDALLKYDKIIGVSEFAQNSVIKVIPKLKNKTVAIPNVIDSNAIIERSKGEIDDTLYTNDRFTILSIGRIDLVKQFELIPEIAQSIVNLIGRRFKWYILGGGEDRMTKMVKDKIHQLGLDDVIFCLGEKKNIYPYLKRSNLVVHTSKSETFSRVVNDAKILGIPVVVNNYDCAPEFLKNGEEGVIVPLSEMGHTISRMIDDNDYYGHFKSVLSGFYYDNETIMNRFYSICEV